MVGGLPKGYADKLTPEASGMCHSDEMKININGKLEWLWDVMDEDTRFQLASQISHTGKLWMLEGFYMKPGLEQKQSRVR